MSSKRRDSFSEAIVGIFMLAVLALLVYFTIVISGVDMLGGRSLVEARVTFTDVGGLKDQDNVMYRGTKVGKVERIILGEKDLTVVMEIDRDVVLRDGYRIAVCNLSMLGGNYLLLEEGRGEKLDLAATVFRGETPTDWMRDISSIAKNVNAITGGGELKAIVTNLVAASESVKVVAGRLERGEGTVGKLLSSDTALWDGVESAATNLAAITADIRRGRGTIGKLMTDDSVHGNLDKTLANIAEISGRLERSEGFLGKLLAKDDSVYGDFSAAVRSFRKAGESLDTGAIVTSATNLLSNLNSVALKIDSGEGTLGRLVNDKTVHEEIEGLTRDVRQVIDNYRDTTPISTFGSLIMGGL
jgi:phospholipid/cholesterol/gamma-HCH transport system substrate-binding protein